MLGETYKLHEFEHSTLFWFVSEGVKGNITKIILFTQNEGEPWNLGFGDYLQGEIHDSVVSNNQDLRKIMFTVAEATYRFLATHPGSVILIQPIDERRKSLYNLIFQKRWHEIELAFHIEGWSGDVKEPYSPNKMYDAFEIQSRNK